MLFPAFFAWPGSRGIKTMLRCLMHRDRIFGAKRGRDGSMNRPPNGNTTPVAENLEGHGGECQFTDALSRTVVTTHFEDV